MKKRKSVGSHQSMCVQPTFIIGTYDEEGNADFAPITWLSVTNDGDRFLLVVSMFGTKKTKMNVQKTGRFSANLVSTDMLPLVDYFGSVSGHKGLKTGMSYGVSEGETVKVPTLDDSRWVYELEVQKTVTCGESDTFFCEIKNVQISEDINISDGIDLTDFDPVVYSGHYHSLGEHLGKIGDFL
ncbi:MAG: flavin reductase [Acetatifactor sp.]